MKRLALEHVTGLEREAAEFQAMSRTLRDLAARCHGHGGRTAPSSMSWRKREARKEEMSEADPTPRPRLGSGGNGPP